MLLKMRFLLINLFFLTATIFTQDLPSSFDLRDIDGHSYIGPIKNQGDVGSCSAFSCISSAESVYNRYYNLYDDKTIDFSESFIIWSLHQKLPQIFSVIDNKIQGSPLSDSLTGLTQYGVPLESNFPYATTDPGEYHWDAPRHTFNSWHTIPYHDIETIKRVIQHYGAVASTVLVDDEFIGYQDGIFTNENNKLHSITPISEPINHGVSLIGWEDNPIDDGIGYWILRNSWGPEHWGEEGYMKIRYNSAQVSSNCSYILYDQWNGENYHLHNKEAINATPWSSGGIKNSYAVDIWGGQESSVKNEAPLSATASTTTEIATSKGIYLWGGPKGSINNTHTIESTAISRKNQAIAYGICAQAGNVINSGDIRVLSDSQEHQSIAYGATLFNDDATQFSNNGNINVISKSSDAIAYGVLVNGHTNNHIVNEGAITVRSPDQAAGIIVEDGISTIINRGIIEVTADSGTSYGITANQSWLQRTSKTTPHGLTIINSGTIKASGTQSAAIFSTINNINIGTTLILQTGSNIVGNIVLAGSNSSVVLQGTGLTGANFYNIGHCTLDGEYWALYGYSYFDSLTIQRGILQINGPAEGDTIIEKNGMLSGAGKLTGNIINHGIIFPENSLGSLSVSGNYTHEKDSIMTIQFSDEQADHLTVTGRAQINGGKLYVVPKGYTKGGIHHFIEANSLHGSFDEVVVPAIFKHYLDNDKIRLGRKDYLELASDTNQKNLARALDSMRPETTGDMANILNTIDTMQLAEVRQAYNNITPEFYGTTTTNHIDNIQKNISLLINRDHASQNWFDNINSYSSFSNYNEKKHSFFVGQENFINDEISIGSAGQFAETLLEGKGSKNKSCSFHGYLYGSYHKDKFFGESILSIGSGKCSSERYIPFLYRKTSSKHYNHDYSAYCGIGYNCTTKYLSIKPSIGAQYIYLHEQGYQEKNGQDTNLVITPRNSHALLSLVNLEISRIPQNTTIFTPKLNCQYGHKFINKVDDVRYSFQSTNEDITMLARKTPRDFINIETSLKAILSQKTSLYLNGSLQNSNGYLSRSFKCGLNIEF
jgi:C1A family cysteine protease/uncharacterized protein YhjY with autotransporter beta-barrel domain